MALGMLSYSYTRAALGMCKAAVPANLWISWWQSSDGVVGENAPRHITPVRLTQQDILAGPHQVLWAAISESCFQSIDFIRPHQVKTHSTC